jgi:hypothetical protein
VPEIGNTSRVTFAVQATQFVGSDQPEGRIVLPRNASGRIAIAVVVVAVAVNALANERLQFQVPADWTSDAAQAQARKVEVYAVDTRSQPPAEMIGARFAAAMTADDAFVRGFLNGARNTVPSLTEVKHEFIDIAGLPSVRVIADIVVEGVQQRQAYYLMPADVETACLIFTTARDGFEGRLGSFDAIARATHGLAPSKRTDSDEEIGRRVGEVVGFFVGLALIYLVVRRLRRTQ